ncbi:hypothetical protein F8388_019611 [Cannabis sativa]|uniref:Carbohydrate kinase PfkB domain-containing protein n=1 Tax=Cannabis sativa TaxID=3483 RepID=A0A7J6E110_CANSA|nr:hypothetical protein F8388_019611 [Cannabis sativa]KAF4351540.1 hypothetical protein G4B88_000578 [Cannabis sativa]
MDSSTARRRLDCISHHLLLPYQPTHFLQPGLVSNGQLESEVFEPVIIGGMVLDIHATPSTPASPRTTTPGMINYVLGGVARNVAECMSKLATKPFMISVLGLDMAGNMLLDHWKSAELSTKGILRQDVIKTAVVSNIFDVTGEVAAGVASVEAIEKYLTPDWIQKFKHNIHSAPVMMVDANLNLSALEFSCQTAASSNTPVWFEPVSVAKSRRIVSVAKYVTFVSPNEYELISMANALTGGSEFSFSPFESDNIESLLQRLKPAIRVLLKNGIKFVVVTLGSKGMLLCSNGEPRFTSVDHEGYKQDVTRRKLYKTVASACPRKLFSDCAKSETLLFAIHLPALPASVVRLTGAGDCLVGGTLSSICAGLDVIQSLAVGIAASKAAVEAEANVPNVLDLASIAEDARLVYSAAKVVCMETMV